jgi:hypothetical protein
MMMVKKGIFFALVDTSDSFPLHGIDSLTRRGWHGLTLGGLLLVWGALPRVTRYKSFGRFIK